MVDSKENLICPACGEEMVKIYDSEKNINVDICLNGCGGILFDNRELNKFDEKFENAEVIFKEIENRTFKEVDTNALRKCPICNVPMVKMGAGIAGVEIDNCNVCGAKFLDNNELKRIREGIAEDNSHLDSMINNLYKDNLKSIVGEDNMIHAKPSPRRQFFENLVKSYLMK